MSMQQQMSHVQQMPGPQAQNQAAYHQNQHYAPASNMAPPSTFHQIPLQNPQQYPSYTSNVQQHVPQYNHPVTPNPQASHHQPNQVTLKPQKPSQSRRPHEVSSNGSMHESRNREQPKAESKSQLKDQAKSYLVDTPTLLVALAEEYFAAAHKIGPSVA
jgi:hypothetical protein